MSGFYSIHHSVLRFAVSIWDCRLCVCSLAHSHAVRSLRNQLTCSSPLRSEQNPTRNSSIAASFKAPDSLSPPLSFSSFFSSQSSFERNKTIKSKALSSVNTETSSKVSKFVSSSSSSSSLLSSVSVSVTDSSSSSTSSTV